MIPSSPTFPDALQVAEKPLHQICFGIQLLSFFTKCNNTKNRKVIGKIGEKCIKINTSCKNTKKLPKEPLISKKNKEILSSKSS